MKTLGSEIDQQVTNALLGKYNGITMPDGKRKSLKDDHHYVKEHGPFLLTGAVKSLYSLCLDLVSHQDNRGEYDKMLEHYFVNKIFEGLCGLELWKLKRQGQPYSFVVTSEWKLYYYTNAEGI